MFFVICTFCLPFKKNKLNFKNQKPNRYEKNELEQILRFFLRQRKQKKPTRDINESKKHSSFINQKICILSYGIFLKIFSSKLGLCCFVERSFVKIQGFFLPRVFGPQSQPKSVKLWWT